jgi:hypothetical protein
MTAKPHKILREALSASIFPSYGELTNTVPLSWSFVAYGIVHGFIGTEAAVSFGLDEITRKGIGDENDIALLDASTDDGFMLQLIKTRLPADAEEVNRISLLWMRVLLWMCCQKVHDVDQLLDYVELVYAEFGYPKEIAPFVRYMPSCGIASDKEGLANALRAHMEDIMVLKKGNERKG